MEWIHLSQELAIKKKKIYGLSAKHFVENLLPKGSTQTLRTRKDGVGKYGRILGEFLVESEWEGKTIQTTVNDELIKTHNAVKYFGQSKDDIEEEHIKNRSLVKLDG
jgi:endonuclease YncB( thermonuclease family)